ncbi:MAG: tetratricopeptide repeat protein [Isosphaeraceae bacterium]
MSGKLQRGGLWVLALAIPALIAIVYAVRAMEKPDCEKLTEQVRLAVRQGQWAHAQQLLDQLRRQHPSQSRVEVLHAELDDARGLKDAAIARLRSIPATEPLAAHARTMAGQIEKGRHRARAAEELFLDALAVDPGLALARRELIWIYAMQGRRAELRAQYLALAQTKPPQFQDVFFWTLSLEDIWINETIREDLKRFLAADPDDRQSRLSLAAVLLGDSNLDESERILAPLSEANVDARIVWARLALGRMQLDRLRALVSEGPAEHAGLALLRGQLAIRTGDPAGAARQFQIALQTDATCHEAISGLALVYRQMGRTEEASQYRRRADQWRTLSDLLFKASNPDANTDLSLQKQLGETCEALHRPAEARAWFELALRLDPTDTSIQRSLYRLRQGSP